MKSKICYIICAGENYGFDFTPGKDDLVIAVDKGFEYIKEKGIIPDVTVGDFDSLGYVPQGDNVLKLNTCKDETDTLSAVRHGLSLGYTEFHIYCGTGGRFDHTIANVQILSYLANRNAQGYLYDKSNIATAIKDSEYRFSGELSGYISVFSLSDESRGVYIENLKYELDGAVLTSDFSIGTSNEFIGKDGMIKVENGTLLIVLPR